MAFLQKREWEWTARDRAAYLAMTKSLAVSPDRVARSIFQSIKAPHAMTGVHAGEVEAVHAATTEAVYRQQLVDVEGQTDVAIFGLPHMCPYNVNSIMNPILVMCMGLGYLFNLYRGKPLVREGGVAILSTRRRGRSTPCTTRPTSTSSKRCCPTPPTRSRSRRPTRSASPPTSGTATCTAPATPTTGSTRSTCGTGAPTPSSIWAGSSSSAATRRPCGAWASRRRRPSTTRWRWRPTPSGRRPTITHFHCPPIMIADVQ